MLEAVSGALVHRRIDATFFIMLANQEDAGYTLYIEVDGRGLGTDCASDIDARLCSANIEYDAKRASSGLKPLKVRRLASGAGDAYRKQRVAAGQRDA